MDDLLRQGAEAKSDMEVIPFAELKSDPGCPSLERALDEVGKLSKIEAIGLPSGLFNSAGPLVVQKYRIGAATEPPRVFSLHSSTLT